MKQLIRIFALVITLNIINAFSQGQLSAQHNNDNYQIFYDQLSSYGEWIENSNYGYVWIPNADPDFYPYLSNGYWALTNYGWTWVSNYEWGWATFHYGRWDYSDYYGWYWVPDNEWGPSWVTWRRSGGYYGWAPMRPGVSISMTFGRDYNVPNDRWIFVRDRDIERHDIYRDHIDRKNNFTYINNSIVINKTYYDDRRHETYVYGPGREDVQKVIGRTIKPFTIYERNKPGQRLNNDQLEIYRPQIQKNNSGNKSAPPKITNLKDVKRISERDAEKQTRDIQPPDNKPGMEKQPVLEPVTKINKKENPSQKRNINLPDNKEQLPVVKPVNKINTKENPSQKRNTNSPKKDVIKEQQHVVNPVNKINNNNRVQSGKSDPPSNDIKTIRTSQPKNTVAPKNNAGSEQLPKSKKLDQSKKNNADQPKSNPNDNKKENRESK
jgi:hypothetical protein